MFFDQRRVDITDQIKYGVHDRLHIYPLRGVFYFPWHRHQIKGTNRFYCLIRKTLAVVAYNDVILFIRKYRGFTNSQVRIKGGMAMHMVNIAVRVDKIPDLKLYIN